MFYYYLIFLQSRISIETTWWVAQADFILQSRISIDTTWSVAQADYRQVLLARGHLLAGGLDLLGNQIRTSDLFRFFIFYFLPILFNSIYLVIK